jgi:SWI/SNF-related matrix-associated actin-dependent regulator 1 of chromatin subfamily A
MSTNVMDYQQGHYVLQCDSVEAIKAQHYGFTRHSSGLWVTRSFDVAMNFKHLANQEASDALLLEHLQRESAVAPSYALKPPKDFSVPAPEECEYKPFQLAGIYYHKMCFDRGLGAYNCDDMGSGKTIQAAGSINLEDDIETVLVFCPSSVKINWMRELHKWLVRDMVIGFAEPGEALPSAHVVICNYDIANKCEKELLTRHWDMIICDEGHYIINESAQRTASVLRNHTDRWLWLSGTFMVNRPKELWTACHTLDRETFPDKIVFEDRYCERQLKSIPTGSFVNPKTGRRTTKWKKVWDSDGASNIEELNYLMRSRFMIRREKKDLMPYLPDKTRQIIVLPSTGCIRKIQAEKKKWEDICNVYGYEAAVQSIQTEEGPAFNEMSAVRKAVSEAKLRASVAFIRDALVSSRKIVVFCHHRDTVEGLMDALVDYRPVPHHGGLSAIEKDASVRIFMEDPDCRVFVGNLKSASTGVDGLQKVSQHAITVEIPWEESTLRQAEDRLHRMGQANSVLSQVLLLEDSLDAKMIGKVLDKQKLFNRLSK